MAMGIDISMLAAWDYTLMALQKHPDEDLLLYLLDTQLRKCKALGLSFVVYDGAQEGSKERSLKFLYTAARQEILCKQRKATRDGLFKPPAKASLATPNNEPKRRSRSASLRAGAKERDRPPPPGLSPPLAAPTVVL